MAALLLIAQHRSLVRLKLCSIRRPPLASFASASNAASRLFSMSPPPPHESPISSPPRKEKVALIGSGNWGSAIAKLIGPNVARFPEFDPEIRMWVYEELIDGRKLTDIINTTHENVKYLPGIPLPASVRAEADLLKAVEDATVLVFVVPHQFVKGVCQKLVGNIVPGAKAISLIKGVDASVGGLTLISDMIHDILKVDVSVLMGANIAQEVALEQFCETTVGSKNTENGQLMYKLFHTPYFRVSVVQDVESVEICGALKNVVGVAAGLVDGLKMGDNTKAAVIRIGLMEMRKFCQMFYSGAKDVTFFESCGVADLITTCYGGRNRKVAEAHVVTGKSFEQLERELLNGQKLQGPMTAQEIHHLLNERKLTHHFPLFTAVYRIVYENVPAKQLFQEL